MAIIVIQSMIKKTILILIIIILSSVMLWGFWGWFVAKESEQQLKKILQKNVHNAQLSSIDAELLNYKTHFLGADASVKVTSKVAFIKEQIGELSLNVKLLNGPLFYDDGKVLFGKALWKISLDSSSEKINILGTEKNKTPDFFKKNTSFLSVLIGFDNSLSYQSHITKLSSASLQIKDIASKGNIDKNALSSHLRIYIKDISLLTDLGIINIPELDISINIDQQPFLLQKHISYITKPFLISLNSSKKLRISFTSKGNFSYINNKLSGLFRLNDNTLAKPILEVAAYNLSVEGYHSFLQVEAHVLNLKQQVQWILEEGAETPEDQDHIWQLYEQLNTIRNSITRVMTEEIFVKESSRLKLSLELPQEKPFLPTLLWLSLKKKLSLLSENGILNQVNTHYQIEIKSNKNKLLINDNIMTWEELLKNI